jgi:hypothetical protein
MAKNREVANLFVEFRATFAKFQSDIQHVSKTLGKFERDAKKVFGNINKFIAAGAAIYGIAKLQNSIVGLIKAGNELGDVSENFRKLGGSGSELAKAQEAILGVVSSVDLMKIANSGMLKGIPGFIDNFEKISDLGNRVGDALGGDTKAGIQQVTDALAQALPKQLQQIGIQIDLKKVYDDYAKSIGTTSEFLDKNQEKLARQTAAMEQLAAATERLAAPGVSADSALQGLNAAITDAMGSIGQAINDNEELARAISELADEIRKTDWSALATVLIEVSKAATQLATGGIALLKWEFAAAGQAVELAISGFSALFDNVLTDAVRNTLVDIGLAAAEMKEQLAPPSRQDSEAWRFFLGNFGNFPVDENKNLTGFLKSIPTKSGADLDAERRAEEARERGRVDAAEKLAKLKKQSDAESKKAYEEAAKAAEDAIKEQNELYAEGVATWRSLFENAITGVTFDLKDALKQVAVGFAADMAQGLLGSVGPLLGLGGAGGIGSGQDLGGMLAQSLLGSFSATATTQAAHAAGVQGPGLASGAFGSAATGEAMGASMSTMGMYAAIAAAVYAVGDFTGDTYKNQNQEYDQYGMDNMWQTAGRAITAYMTMGISEGVLAVMSSGAISNPETLARKDITGKLEEMLGKNSMFYDAQGKLSPFSGDIKTGGTDRFNQPGWADAFNQQEGSATFAALGQGLSHLLGVTEDVGAQIGVILSENLLGNLDNARMLVDQLGISQEQMTEQFVMMGEAGTMSWLEVESAIQAIGPAFGEGLTKQADMVGAFEQLVSSAGDGKDAIIAVKNMAIEAGEAGISSFGAWKQALLDAGKDPEMVEAFFTALSQRGLDTLEKIKDASTRTVGGVIADMQALSPTLSDQWVTAQEEAQKYIDTIQTIPDDSVKNLTFNVDANISEDARTAMSMSGTGIDVSGMDAIPTETETAAPEARSLNTGGNGGTYFLDLRGAAPGVDSEVRRALKEIENEIVVKSMNSTSAQARRGGSFGARFNQ